MDATDRTAANSDARKRNAERASLVAAADVEALAEVLLASWAMQSMLTPPFDTDRDDARKDARAVLDSDWLAAHDAEVRREHGEWIAREWQFGGWTILTAPPTEGAIPPLALGQRVTDWLRDRTEADR